MCIAAWPALGRPHCGPLRPKLMPQLFYFVLPLMARRYAHLGQQPLIMMQDLLREAIHMLPQFKPQVRCAAHGAWHSQ